MSFQSTKTYGHDLGLSACFRQWRATHSHCKFIHGYALKFHFVFSADKRDENGWVVDFGSLNALKQRLVAAFDHKLVVAGDDPQLAYFEQLHREGIADVLILPHGVGCEAFAKIGWAYANQVLEIPRLDRGVRVVSCECAEHGANSAIYLGDC